MKKTISIFISIVLSLLLALTLCASNVSAVSHMPIYQLVEYSPADNIVSRDGFVPTNYFVITANTPYYFDGTAQTSPLYSNYIFTGCSTYMLVAYNNNYNRSQRVELISAVSGRVLAEYSIPAGSYIAYHITTSDPWYLKFDCNFISHSCNVNGYVYATVEN